MPTPVVIDLSHWNVVPDSLRQAAASGIVGVIHKLTEGAGYTDDKVGARWVLAEDAGMAWGLYHFIRPGDPVAQADFFLDQAEKLSVIDRNTLLALDWEDGDVPAEDALAFLERIEEKTGRSPVLYSGNTCKEDPDPGLADYRLWLAQYAKSCSLPSFAEEYWLWQYTDDGTVPGVTPPTDLNALFPGRTTVQLLAEWAGGDVVPRPERPDAPVVSVIISAPKGVKIDVQVIEDDDDGGNG